MATVPLVVGNVANRRTWQSVPSAYLFPSAGMRQEFESLGLPAERCFIKPNLVYPVGDARTRENVVVYLGRLSEEKGLRQLMGAWDRYLAGRPTPGLRLAVAGAGPLEAEFRAWAASRPSVSALGLLDRGQCSALVSRARAVVAPSLMLETFGLVVAEAMAASVAPIAANHGGYAGLITHEVDGLLYPPQDTEALARLLQRVESAPETMDEMGRAARATYLRRFTPAKNVAEMERIYRFAIAHPRWKDQTDQSLLHDEYPQAADF